MAPYSLHRFLIALLTSGQDHPEALGARRVPSSIPSSRALVAALPCALLIHLLNNRSCSALGMPQTAIAPMTLPHVLASDVVKAYALEVVAMVAAIMSISRFIIPNPFCVAQRATLRPFVDFR